MYNPNKKYSIAVSYSWDPSDEIIIMEACRNAWTELVKIVNDDMLKAQEANIIAEIALNEEQQLITISYPNDGTECYYKLIPDKKELKLDDSKIRKRPGIHRTKRY